MGAIGGFLYGEDKDAKTKLRQSRVGQRNREILVNLSSQVYAYIASIIGSSGNLNEFVFRIWIRFGIYRHSGEIVKTPEFSVEIFRFVGVFGGTTAPAKTFTLSVIFVGIPGNPYLTSFFTARMREIKKDFRFVKFEIAQDHVSAPKEVQPLIEENKPYLVVENQAFEISTEIDAATKNPVSYCLHKKGKSVEKFMFTDAKSIARFVLRYANPRPELHRRNVSLQRTDTEVEEIEGKLEEAVTEGRSRELDIASIEESFLTVAKKMEGVKESRLRGNAAKVFPELKNRFAEVHDNFRRLKIRHISTMDQLRHVERELRRDTTSEQYVLLRSRVVNERFDVEEKIITTQSDLYQNILPKLEVLAGKIRGARAK